MDKIGFNLEKINTEQFAIIENSYDDGNDSFSIDANLSFGVDFENGAIRSMVQFQFIQEQKPFIVIKASCEFDISNDFWSSFENDDEIVLPKGFMAHLAMITVGTTRGILHSKTENTQFNDFVLPTVNVAEMINEDGVFTK